MVWVYMIKVLDDRKLKEFFAAQGDVSFALLFGSMASGRANSMSDIDIAVYLDDKRGVLDLGERQIEITYLLMKVCSTDKVDTVVLNQANPFLKFQVLKYGRLIYAQDEKLFYHFKAQAFGLYQDIKPMYDFYAQAVNKNLRRGLNG